MAAINSIASVRAAFMYFAEECHIGCTFSEIHVYWCLTQTLRWINGGFILVGCDSC